MIEETDGAYQVFNGRAGIELTESLRAGCVGLIPGAETADVQAAIYDLVLAGDGEENGQAVSSAEEIARDYGPMLDLVDAALVLGYGTEQGATMPFDGGLVSDPQGSGPGVSKSDPENLQAVADAVGGTYLPVVRGGDSPTDVTQIATQLREQAYADLPAAVSAREVTWMWALLLLALILPELTTAWRDWWQTRRFVRGGTR